MSDRSIPVFIFTTSLTRFIVAVTRTIFRFRYGFCKLCVVFNTGCVLKWLDWVERYWRYSLFAIKTACIKNFSAKFFWRVNLVTSESMSLTFQLCHKVFLKTVELRCEWKATCRRVSSTFSCWVKVGWCIELSTVYFRLYQCSIQITGGIKLLGSNYSVHYMLSRNNFLISNFSVRMMCPAHRPVSCSEGK